MLAIGLGGLVGLFAIAALAGPSPKAKPTAATTAPQAARPAPSPKAIPTPAPTATATQEPTATPTPTPVPTAAPTPVPPPPLPTAPPCAGLTCVMTKQAGFHGLLVPSDATPHAESLGPAFDTNEATVDELAEYYLNAMREQGWVWDSKDSAKASWGYEYIFCQPGPEPVNNLSIGLQGPNTNSRAMVYFSDVTPEGTCPP